MKKYIGTKIIHAEPATGPDGDGYNVTYKDGYKSWSPKQAFEEAYVAVDDIPSLLSSRDIDQAIVNTQFIRIENTTTTLCALTLKNGFTVIGKSACVNPSSFDEVTGKSIAYEDAFDKVWELEGYLLAQRRFEAGVK